MSWKPRGKLGRSLNVEQPLRLCQHFLRPRNPLLDRSLTADESARNLTHAEAAKDVQHQRDPRVFTQPRMTAGEHHPKLIVLDRVRVEHLVDRRNQRPLALDHAGQLGGVAARCPLAAQNVDGAMLGRGHQPRGGVRGHPAELPHLDRAAEGVLYDVFCQREVVNAEEPRERDHHASGFVPEELGVELSGITCSSAGSAELPPRRWRERWGSPWRDRPLHRYLWP